MVATRTHQFLHLRDLRFLSLQNGSYSEVPRFISRLRLYLLENLLRIIPLGVAHWITANFYYIRVRAI